MTNSTLKAKTLFISGCTRGIGREIALKAAADGANIIVTGKSITPNKKKELAGTIHTVAEEIVQAGGQALALQLDVRDDEAILDAVQKGAEHFGGIDILVNNASAIHITPTLQTPLKKFDLMFNVNVRATFACSQACLPYLKKAENAHILTLSPPLNMKAKWFKDHLAYTMAKYGMSMCTLGMAEEFKADGISVNSLWPQTLIATAAIAVNLPQLYAVSRKPSIVADAAHCILTSTGQSGNFFIDEEVLRTNGVKDFEQYLLTPGTTPFEDLFL